jgi:hypothetical protein
MLAIGTISPCGRRSQVLTWLLTARMLDQKLRDRSQLICSGRNELQERPLR